jgi:ATP-dependent exoDNAse (exonuclease V) alpha subunit
VDEAGLLSVRDLLAVVEATRALQARLILSGDSLQHHSVEAGDALRLLEGKSALRTVTIRNIKRQVEEEYRKAIAELAQGQGQTGLSRLERLGAVKELPDDDRYRTLADDYVASVKAGKTALAVSPTWREIEFVTDDIRRGLKSEKLLSKEENILEVHHGLKWTRAEKRDLRNYKPGMILTFHKATKEFKVNEWAELERIEGEKLRLKKPDGGEVLVTGKQSGCFDVAEKQKLPVAAGEKLLLQGNRKGDRLFNGQVVTVEAVQKDGGIRLEDGRKIRPDFRAFTHGYCLTSHASQGRKADHVFVAVDSPTFNAANLNQFYVSASRGVERVQIYTDKIDFLRDAVTRPGRRMSASELAESVRLSRSQKTGPQQAANQKMSV